MIWWKRWHCASSEREAYIDGLVAEVSQHMKGAGIEADIEGRAKHFFSIYTQDGQPAQDDRSDL